MIDVNHKIKIKCKFSFKILVSIEKYNIISTVRETFSKKKWSTIRGAKVWGAGRNPLLLNFGQGGSLFTYRTFSLIT